MPYCCHSVLCEWLDAGVLAGWRAGLSGLSGWCALAVCAIKTCGRWLPNSDPNLQLPLSEDGNMQTRIPGRPLRRPDRVLRCIITSPTFDCHDRRALHVVLSRARRRRPACACLPACLSICLCLCLPAPAGKVWRCPREAAKVRQENGHEGRKDPGTEYCRQTGKRDPGSWGTTEYPSPRFIQLLSPSSPPYDSLWLFSLPLSPSHRIPGGQQCLACLLCALGEGVHRRQRHNQIKSGRPLSSPP